MVVRALCALALVAKAYGHGMVRYYYHLIIMHLRNCQFFLNTFTCKFGVIQDVIARSLRIIAAACLGYNCSLEYRPGKPRGAARLLLSRAPRAAKLST